MVAKVVKPLIRLAAMMPNIIECEQGKFLIVNYDAFDRLGITLEQKCIEVAIPLYENIGHALIDVCRHTHLQFPVLTKSDCNNAQESDITSWESQRRAQLNENTHFPSFLFRGEKIQRHGLMPSAFRYLQNDNSLEEALNTVSKRLNIESVTAKKLQNVLRKSRNDALDDQQAKAAARHYGAPSHYMDFTLDPAVAGYFGHPGNLSDEEFFEPGVIYGINPEIIQTAFPCCSWVCKEKHHGVQFSRIFTGATLKYLAFDKGKHKVVEKIVRITGVADFLTDSAPFIRHIYLSNIRRVVAQQGVFVGIDNSYPTQKSVLSQYAIWYLIDFISFKWSFWHNQSPFEVPERGISTERLYVSDGSDFDSIEANVKEQLRKLR